MKNEIVVNKLQNSIDNASFIYVHIQKEISDLIILSCLALFGTTKQSKKNNYWVN